jgi:Fructose-2,6-bisphosphatase
MTTIYFIRHSKGIGNKVKNFNYNEPLQLQNERTILSIEGEERAKVLSELKEFNDIDCVISSNYIRTMATAKYFASKNDLDILIDEDFRERRQGVSSYSELGEDFFTRQFEDENYKIGDGESQKEVRERMEKGLNNALEQYKDKRIVILSHATAIMFLFKKWCDITTDSFSFKITYKNKEVWNNQFDAPEVFKLTFDENELISIENIRPNELSWKNTPLI